ncbi:MAG: glutamine--tRNA ligase/YqeY domain fusion protein [Oscillospiraceae bacterium]|nr:glutamine--tRNA ligase/YqeY domain fusion protein [Oscillospiraceae bacterium]
MSEGCGSFLYTLINEDFSENGRFYGKTIKTRFPPEPNGFLHIGHAKAICIDFMAAQKFGGLCNLRMDDTNPTKEESIYTESIKNDVKWLGFDWEDRFFYASDYFEEMFEIAKKLIKKGLAYVCDLTSEETKKFRGDLTSPAKSPYRDRLAEESLDLFIKMRNGEFPNGARTLRARIDLASGNFNMRDPVIYRILKVSHHRTKNEWPIYPMYDYAHPIEDALEGITHSLCSLEFEDHRPLYDWVINNIDLPAKPRQIEFSRLNLSFTVMSKRKLRRLVEEKFVDSWDDPRMPTLSGLRRRGYTSEAIKDFCEKIGVAKASSVVDHSFLESCLRKDLNIRAKRVMAVIEPIMLIIENYPKDKFEEFEIENNPKNQEQGKRKLIFGRRIYVEKSDFSKEAIKGFFRLYPGSIVRLKSAYAVECTGFKEDEHGNIQEIYAKYYPKTSGGTNLEGKKIKSTIHWVSDRDCFNAQIKVYDPLFSVASPESEGDFVSKINPDSLKIFENCKLERGLKSAKVGENFQFLRIGYFCLDKEKTSQDQMIFNRSVTLKDGFKKT